MDLFEVKKRYDTLLEGIDVCKDNDLIEPVFIILYSTIDSLAWLNSDEKNVEARRVGKEFKDFSSKYIINKLTQNITADELYNARCAIVHTISAKSSGNIKNGVRYLTYANSPQAEIEGNNILKSLNENAVCINALELIEALSEAIVEFFEDISKDNVKENIVIQKSENYYSLF